MFDKIHIEKAAFDFFIREFKKKDSIFKGLRLGQAFYNNFHLNKMADQHKLAKLYESDGKQAIQEINNLFEIK